MFDPSRAVSHGDGGFGAVRVHCSGCRLLITLAPAICLNDIWQSGLRYCVISAGSHGQSIDLTVLASVAQTSS